MVTIERILRTFHGVETSTEDTFGIASDEIYMASL
jgi:hypothetical protein